MDIEVSTQGEVSVVAPSGVLDGKAALAFERKLAELLDAKVMRLVIDLTRVTLVTSAGIRALVMAAKRLRGVGALALCGLTPHVKGVFDVAGLSSVFTITASAAEAVASVAAAHGQRQAAAHSRLGRLMLRVLGSGEEASPPVPAPAGPPSALAATVAKLLAGR
jgi:anti-anti-sigma factor